MRVQFSRAVLVGVFAVFFGASWMAVGHGEPPATKQLIAGSFSVTAPVRWAEKAVIEKVPIKPVYTPSDWAAFKKDRIYILKPSYENRPQHWAIRLPALAMRKSDGPGREADDPTAPQILIHQSGEWTAAFEDGTSTPEGVTITIAQLRSDLNAWDKENQSSGSPAFVDAHLDFVCLKKRLRFKGGYGYRIITQWDVEPTIATKGDLHYLFFGMSDDDTCQIIATFPIDLPGLGDREKIESEHLGYSVSRYSDLERDWKKYEGLSQKWITRNAARAKPAIKDLDAMIESLVAKTWQP